MWQVDIELFVCRWILNENFFLFYFGKNQFFVSFVFFFFFCLWMPLKNFKHFRQIATFVINRKFLFDFKLCWIEIGEFNIESDLRIFDHEVETKKKKNTKIGFDFNDIRQEKINDWKIVSVWAKILSFFWRKIKEILCVYNTYAHIIFFWYFVCLGKAVK